MSSKPPYQPVLTNMSDWMPWCQSLATTINNCMAGKQNVTLDTFTLSADATTTVITDPRIGATSYLHLVPLTETAANEKYWLSEQKKGTATISHTNSAVGDRTYRVVILA